MVTGKKSLRMNGTRPCASLARAVASGILVESGAVAKAWMMLFKLLDKLTILGIRNSI